MKYRVAYIIGAGSIGLRHAENLRSLEIPVKLISFRELDLVGLQRSLDEASILVCATPTYYRSELIEVASERNSLMYCEKPACTGTEQVDFLFSRPAEWLSASVVGLMTRYHPGLRWLASLDLAGVISARFRIGQDITQWRKGWDFESSYASRSDVGGALFDLCHELDLAELLFPGLIVSSVNSLCGTEYQDVDFYSSVQLSNASTGTVVSVEMDYLAKSAIRDVELRFRDRTVTLDLLSGKALIHSSQNGLTSLDFPTQRSDWFFSLMRDFVHRSEIADPMRPSFANARSSIELTVEARAKRTIVGFVDDRFVMNRVR